MGPRERHMRTTKTHLVPAIVGSFIGFLLIAGIAFGIGMLGNVSRWLQDLPDYTNTDLYLTSEPTTVLDAQGNQIASFYAQNRKSITIDQVSPYVLDGTVATEDERFYEHNGVDLMGIMRAVVVQLTGGHEGASTITQQLVRNTILSDEQFDDTLERKVREAYLALKMEEIYSKEEILMMYLNSIYYGHGAYGIQAAAETYFSKNALDLTLAEAALLVGLPNSPSRYDPTVNPDLALQRRNTVLDRMLSNGKITQEEHDAAQAEELVLNVTENSSTGIEVYSQPYFVDYVRSLLSEEFDYDSIFSGGLTVYTTIDPTIQAAAESSVVEQLDRWNLDGLDAGMTVLENGTGYIRAMVGGRDYYADNEHTNHATSGRQVGSSFKAFTLATALKQGMNPEIRINCGSPMYFDYGADEPYKVQNYGNQSYGTITLARATEYSSNTGYVQVANAVGVQNVIDTCRDLGITAEMDATPSLTLGTPSISTLDMAEAYSTFATGGYHREAVAITKIENRDGEVIYEHQDAPEQVLDTSVTQALTEVLEGVISNSGATGTAARLSVDQPIAGKTGTSTNTCDLWFCGYTPQYTLAVWTGYTAGSIPIYVRGREALGSDFTLPMARNTLNTILEGVERAEFPTSDTPIAYKDDSVWEAFGKSLSRGGGSSSSSSSSSSEQSASTEEATTTEQPATSVTSPTSPTTPTSPSSPSAPSSPSTPTTPTGPTTPATPTTPTGPTEGDGTNTQSEDAS
ncbi:penicillin-binding protein [Collinsella sp. An7]|nr:PBP1A family penicillin-binding protein [Collinsella sp. An7]OUN48282.1 penicillin-binding protein [Collinsella sp. An7]